MSQSDASLVLEGGVSPSGTEVNLSTWDFEPRGHRGDFARIIPLNRLARESFNDVAKRFDTDDEWMIHARKFIEFTEDAEEQGYVGYYRLNMNLLPHQFRMGWMLGSGDPRRPEQVHFVLTTSPKAHNVGQRHCHLYHHPTTDVLMIRARYDVTIDGKTTLRGTQAERNSRNVQVVDKVMGIGVGDLLYRLEFTNLNDTGLYKQQLAEHRCSRGDVPQDVPQSVSPTPPTTSLGRWRIYDPAFGGVSSTVAFGYHGGNGDLIAVKSMRRNSFNAGAIKAEITMLRSVSHPNICGLLEVIGDEHRQIFASNEADGIKLVLSPAATATLDRSQAGAKDAVILLRDCCTALAFLHSKGILHRDLKPHNIGVWKHPPKAILLDLGHAIFAKQHHDHMKGTLRYLAPEVVALKQATQETTKTPYGSAADIWSLGISFSEVAVGLVPWKWVNEQSWRTRFLSETPPPPQPTTYEDFFRQTILSAVCWSPQERPDAKALVERISAFIRQQDLKRKTSAQ